MAVPLTNVYLALDISERGIASALIDKEGRILDRRFSEGRPEDSRCIACVKNMLALCSLRRFRPLAAGIATRGNVQNGVVSDGWSSLDSNIKHLFEKTFPLQTEVLNRFHAAALGVSFKLKEDSCAVISMSNGAGYGMVRKGKVEETYDPIKGVGGLSVIERLSDGKKLRIGDIASAKSVKIRVKEVIGKDCDFGEIFQLAKENGAVAAILNDAVDAASELIVDLEKTQKPDKSMGIAYEGLCESDRKSFFEKIKTSAEEKLKRAVRIHSTDMHEVDARLMGAARAAMQRYKHIFAITGEPTAGKSTFSENLFKELKKSGIKVGGVITKEVVDSEGKRIGFSMTDLLTLKTAELARVGVIEGGEWRLFANRYSVNVKNVNDFVVNALRAAKENADFIFIDEVAPMQLFSKSFEDCVAEIIDSEKPAIFTVKLDSDHQMVQHVKERARNQGLLLTLNASYRKASHQAAHEAIRPLLAREVNRITNPASK